MKTFSTTIGRHTGDVRLRISHAVLLLTTLGAVIVAASGCNEPPVSLEKKRSTESELGGGFGRENFSSLKDAQPVVAPIPADIDIQPANGAVFGNRLNGLSVTFTGFSDKAGQAIEIQVLNAPNAAITEANWVTIATTTTAATPTTFNDPTPIFRYSVQALPAEGNRWQNGGLLRYRAVAVEGAVKTMIPFFDHTSNQCVAKLGAKSWKEVIAKCKSPFSPDLGAPTGGQVRAAALVSTNQEPGGGFFSFPNYLSRKGFIFDFETDNYYFNIDAPQTLDEFQFRFGFFNRNNNNNNNGFDDGTIYYNLGDLGIGREMHCTTFQNRFNGEIEQGTACYVRNYGVFNGNVLDPDFSGDPGSALRDAVDGFNSFATVAMVKFGNKYSNGPNDVQFFVYNAQDQIANLAQLDSVASNEAIPNNCLNCHGGKYDRRTGELTGASFLPFDPEAFLYPTRNGFTYADQEEQFRKLNVIVKNAGAPPATVQYVDGLYDNKAEIPGTKANLDWIPPGWSGDEESKTVYREVYKPFCRTCHVSQVGDFAFMRMDDFKKENAKTTDSVCGTHEMPVAEATLSLFWRSPARSYLVNSLGLSTSCAPK